MGKAFPTMRIFFPAIATERNDSRSSSESQTLSSPIACFPGYALLVQDFRVDDVFGASARQERCEVSGDHPAMGDLGVIGCAADVGCEEHIF